MGKAIYGRGFYPVSRRDSDMRCNIGESAGYCPINILVYAHGV
jgi:hypothetical protein